ncbi:MAG: translation elongation factor Ts [Anaerolineales bacterium]|jgi:elongation factor Ts
MSIPASQVKELREQTGAGVLDCHKALEETGGDIEKAADLLRKQGLDKAAKRAERETREGVLDLYSHGDGRVGAMVEVNCETDFVARTEGFRTFAHEMALQVVATAPQWVSVEDVPEEVLQEKREAFRQEAIAEGKPEKVIDRIVEGRMEKLLQDMCLLSQPYIRDDTKTVSDLLQETIAATGENIAIRRFVRWSVGGQE